MFVTYQSAAENESDFYR